MEWPLLKTYGMYSQPTAAEQGASAVIIVELQELSAKHRNDKRIELLELHLGLPVSASQ